MRSTAHILLFVCLSCSTAFAQPLLSVGVKGGVPLTDFFADTAYPLQTFGFSISPTRTFNSSKNYVVGAVVEFMLPFRLSLEADGLYRPLGVTYEYAEFTPPNKTPASSDSWEIPILAKYRFIDRKFKPFIDAGPAFRLVAEPRNRFLSKSGAAAGAGVDFRALNMRFESELRYTYWTTDPGIAMAAHLGTHHNQAELLIGLLF